MKAGNALIKAAIPEICTCKTPTAKLICTCKAENLHVLESRNQKQKHMKGDSPFNPL
jgi:hypothetical protein